MNYQNRQLLKSLKELEGLKIDKEDLEIAKAYQDYQLAQRPFYRTPTFITVVISVFSLLITGLLGFTQMMSKKDQEIEAQKQANARERRQAQREYEAQRLTIQNLLSDTLKASSQKATIELQIASLRMQDASKSLQDQFSRNQDANFRLIELRRNTGMLQDQKEKLDREYASLMIQQHTLKDSIERAQIVAKSLDESSKLLAGKLNQIELERKKTELIKLYYGLKSALINYITPNKNTFSGILVSATNQSESARREKVDDMLSLVLSNDLLHDLLKKNYKISYAQQLLTKKVDELKSDFNSNKLWTNSKTYLKFINPLIDEILMSIDTMDNETLLAAMTDK